MFAPKYPPRHERHTKRADDARGDRVLEAEGRADGNDPLAHLEPRRVAELHDGQGAGGLDLDQRHVGALVGADHACLEIALVGQLDGDLVRVVDPETLERLHIQRPLALLFEFRQHHVLLHEFCGLLGGLLMLNVMNIETVPVEPPAP